ncbi:MAG: peptidoglycan DD-metalloendopeptidase family protein [Burkholderiales bacterium]|nr:peptidoglycan DD-metalloendopeptidase family protein [Burkholderiales bacterium]
MRIAPRRDGGARMDAIGRSRARVSQCFLLAAFSLCAVTAFGVAQDTAFDVVPTRLVERVLPLPALDRGEDTAVYWREERVQRGDTVGSLLARAGMSDAGAMYFLRTDAQARPVSRLRPGRAVQVAIQADGDLVALRFVTEQGDRLTVERGDDQAFQVSRSAVAEETRTALRTGEIRTSLFAAADEAGIPDRVIVALADVFAADIDFYKDVQRGDRFAVVYETRTVDGEPAGTGRILAAEFVNRGVAHRAFRWRTEDGTAGYYTESGRSARSAFLRSPMELSRITSGFTLARFHPIQRQWRAHEGIDYAAPTGTPVRATADGAVAVAGWQNGYGNVIVVRHHGSYSTLYGHLSRLAAGLKPGDRVGQGQTIGYVGMTGWATGPHLHYEFRVNDHAHDPMTTALPPQNPLRSLDLAAFRSAIEPLADSLTLARSLPGATLAAAD